MIKYNCQRCGYNTNHKNTFRKHLLRKKICSPVLDDIKLKQVFINNNIEFSDDNTIIVNKCHPNVNFLSFKCQPKNDKKLPENKSKYVCKYCDKSFKYRQSKSKHEISRCKVKKEEDFKKNLLYDKIEDIVIEMTKLKEENEKLKTLININL